MFSFSPPHATDEKSKIGIINFERRIPCYRIIIIHPCLFFLLWLYFSEYFLCQVQLLDFVWSCMLIGLVLVVYCQAVVYEVLALPK